MKQYFTIIFLTLQFFAFGQNEEFSFEKERLTLGLNSLEKSYDNLILRLWIAPTLTNRLELLNVVFTKSDSTVITYFSTDENGKLNIEKKYTYKTLEDLREFLMKNNYSTLPNYRDIFPKLEKRMPDGIVIDPMIIGDGVNYTFQFKNIYSKREYTYHCPFKYQMEYPKLEEFINVTKIILRLQTELKVKSLTKC